MYMRACITNYVYVCLHIHGKRKRENNDNNARIPYVYIK